MGAVREAVAALLALAVAGAAGQACTSGSVAAGCDTAQCVAGNTCIATANAAASCQLGCTTNTDCPFNYHCDPNVGGTSPYCVLNTTAFPDKPGTQFGAPCNPTNGFENNPACDTADGFWCNAASPLDANAYCTYFGCKVDTDCGDGFYCGRENQYPNAVSDQIQNGQTLAVCLPRDSCAPCTSEIDCAPANGAPQHCLPGSDGATFCAPECHSTSECALDATCAPYQNYSACTPRAGVCKGDGSLCSPCRSDADCTNGYCLLAYNSTEHFCSSKSGIACSYSNSQIVDQCPTSTTATPIVGCSTPGIEPTYPPNQCEGEVQEGLNDNGQPEYVEGCWSVH
jgi:hypothetical protein